MFEAAALIISLVGGAFIALNVSGKTISLPGGGSIIPESDPRREAINNQIRKYLNGEYPDFTERLLHAKVGGANGIPANAQTAKILIAYWAGWYLGYYDYLGDIFQPQNFNEIAGGTAGRWTYSDYPGGEAFDWAGIENVSWDDGNDFGLARNTGTWFEENFNTQCVFAILQQTSEILSTGGAATNPGGIASLISQCRTN